MKKIIIIMVAIVLLMSACSKEEKTDKLQDDTTNTEANNEKKEEVNDEPILAPDFELEDLEGNMVKLSSFQGKKVIINFWATWCKFCVREMPDLKKLQDEYKDDLVVLYVNVGESKEDVAKFVEKEKITGTILLDKKQELATTYGVLNFPTTFAINEKGELLTRYIGKMEYEMMVSFYEAIK